MKLLKYLDLNRRAIKAKKLDHQEVTEARSNFIQQWMSSSEVSVKSRGDILVSFWTVFTQREEGQLSLALTADVFGCAARGLLQRCDSCSEF